MAGWVGGWIDELLWDCGLTDSFGFLSGGGGGGVVRVGVGGR